MKNVTGLNKYCSILSGLVAFLTSAPLAMASRVPLDEAPFSARSHLKCTLNADGSKDCIQRSSYTILRQAGVQMLSKASFSYPEKDTLTIEDASVVQPDKSRIELKDVLVDTRMSPNPAQGFLRQKQTSLAVPRLQVGSVISYVIRRHIAANPPLDGGAFAAQIDDAPGRTDAYELELVSERPFVWRAANADDFEIESSADHKRLVMRQKAKVRFDTRIDEPPGSFRRDIPRLVVSSSSDPQEVFGGVANKWNAVLQAALPADVKKVVHSFVELSEIERIKKAMDYIHARYRYLGDWQASDRGYLPFALSAIAQHGYGDCKDLSMLLVAMLREAGVDADPALVQRGPYADPLLLPAPSAPNHAIVRARVNGQTWWLDPTNPVFLPGFTPTDISDRWAIVINRDGKVGITEVTQDQPIENRLDHRITMRLQADGSALGLMDLSLVGNPVFRLGGLEMIQSPSAADRALCADADDACKVARERLSFILPERYLLKVTFETRRAANAISGGKLVLNHKDNDFHKLRKYISDGDLNDVFVGSKKVSTSVVTLTNADLDVLPKPCQSTSKWIDYAVTWDKTGEGPRFAETTTFKTSWLTHQDLVSQDFKAFLEAAQQCSSSLRQVVTLRAGGHQVQ